MCDLTTSGTLKTEIRRSTLKKPCECVRVCQRQRPSIKSTVLLTRVMIDETWRQQNAHNQNDLFAIRLLFFSK